MTHPCMMSVSRGGATVNLVVDFHLAEFTIPSKDMTLQCVLHTC